MRCFPLPVAGFRFPTENPTEEIGPYGCRVGQRKVHGGHGSEAVVCVADEVFDGGFVAGEEGGDVGCVDEGGALTRAGEEEIDVEG